MNCSDFVFGPLSLLPAELISLRSLLFRRSTRNRVFLAFVVFCGVSALSGQTAPSACSVRTASATTEDNGPTGIVPFYRGYNVSLLTTSLHDSASGWNSVLSPDLAFRFNKHFSAEVMVPLFSYIEPAPAEDEEDDSLSSLPSKVGHFIPADAVISGHVQFQPALANLEFTASLGLPTGDQSYGLGVGRVTYAINNHIQRSYGPVSPEVEIGVGNSTSLEQMRVVKSYLIIGTLAHFLAGMSFDLPFNTSFSADAYEELPLTKRALLSLEGSGSNSVQIAGGSSEDNGVQTSLDIPLTRHMVLSGLYNRSFRLHTDTAGFSLLFLLKAPPKDDTP